MGRAGLGLSRPARLLFKDQPRAYGDSTPGRMRTTRRDPGRDVEEIGEDGSPTEEEVQRSPGRWSSTAMASEMGPREDAASPVDTVRRRCKRGRSNKAVIAEGDGKRGSMEGSPNKVESEPISFHTLLSIYILLVPIIKCITTQYRFPFSFLFCFGIHI